MNRRGRSLLSIIVVVFSALLGGSGVSRAQDPALVGQWASPMELGIQPRHVVTLKTGEVLLFTEKEEVGEDVTECVLLDPQNNGVSSSFLGPVAVPGISKKHILGCSSHVGLPDGRVSPPSPRVHA